MRTKTGLAVGEILEERGSDIHAPALCDVEVVSALRKIIRDSSKTLDEVRANEAIDDLLDLPITHHSHEYLIRRTFELRDNFSAYDAVYVALAEALDAELVTADRGLAKASVSLGVRVRAH